MERATEHNCGACSSPEVQALLCELLDESTTYARALAIREHIAECDFCQKRLESEEIIRSLVRNCCNRQAKAPQALRRRISVEITRIDTAW